MDKPFKPLTYKDSGVDINAGDASVERIKALARATYTPGVLSGVGGFNALFSLKETGLKDPVLVSGTDGVGTKLKIAFALNIHDTIGIDAVAMCVNDVLCSGARPLFFLDYIATGRLEPQTATDVVKGVAEGCRQAGCALIGGEIAEMPGFYADGEYDIAGFSVGAVERDRIVDGSAIQPDDVVLGLASSGVHSNGFSLIRKAVAAIGLQFDSKFPRTEDMAGKILLTPTRIYAKEVSHFMQNYSVHGIAHITGGGLIGNTVRIIPKGLHLEINWDAWPRPSVFTEIQKMGAIEEEEMRKVFNLGIGMVVILPPAQAAEAVAQAAGSGQDVYSIGKITK
jgi:phosphoribosylformylglycinamidine cyclo-ligase